MGEKTVKRKSWMIVEKFCLSNPHPYTPKIHMALAHIPMLSSFNILNYEKTHIELVTFNSGFWFLYLQTGNGFGNKKNNKSRSRIADKNDLLNPTRLKVAGTTPPFAPYPNASCVKSDRLRKEKYMLIVHWGKRKEMNIWHMGHREFMLIL